MYSARDNRPGNVAAAVFIAAAAAVFAKDLYGALVREFSLNVFPSDLSIPDARIAVGLLGAAFLIFGFRRGSFSLRRVTPAGFLLLAYWIWLAFAALIGGRFDEINLAAILLIGIVSLSNLNSATALKIFSWTLRVYAISCAVWLLLGLGIHDQPESDTSGLSLLSFRFAGIFSHPNLLAMVMAIGTLVEFLSSRRKSRYWWLAIFVFLMFLSQSSGSAVALSVALFVIVLTAIRSNRPMGDSRIPIAFASVIGITALVAMTLSGRVTDVGSFTSGRVSIWLHSLGSVNGNVLLGAGKDGLKLLDEPAIHAHNDLVQALTLGGVPGAVVLLAAMGFLASALLNRNLNELPLVRSLSVFLLVLSLVEIPLSPSFSVVALALRFVIFDKPLSNKSLLQS